MTDDTRTESRFISAYALSGRPNYQQLSRWWQLAREDSLPISDECTECGEPTLVVHDDDDGRALACTRCHGLWLSGELSAASAPTRRKDAPAPIQLPARVAEVAARDFERLNRAKRESGGDVAQNLSGDLAHAAIGLPMTRVPRGRFPGLTLALSGALVAAFFLTTESALVTDAAVAAMGFVPADWGQLGGLTIWSSALLHANLGHLLGNLFFIGMVGAVLERATGRGQVAIVALVAPLIAAVLLVAFSSQPSVPVVGASTIATGLLFFFCAAFPAKHVHIPVAPSVGRKGFVGAPAVYLGVAYLLYIGMQVAFPGSTPVSGLAHLGGAVAGIALAVRWRRSRAGRAFRARARREFDPLMPGA